MLDFCVKTRIRFSLRDKRLFEITEVEITRVDCSCNFNLFIPSRLFYPYQKDESIFQLRDASYSLLSFLFHIKGKYLFEYANIIDPDQTLHTAVPDLGLHCLFMSYLSDASHESI